MSDMLTRFNIRPDIVGNIHKMISAPKFSQKDNNIFADETNVDHKVIQCNATQNSTKQHNTTQCNAII